MSELFNRAGLFPDELLDMQTVVEIRAAISL
jgi:hypothetical protein